MSTITAEVLPSVSVLVAHLQDAPHNSNRMPPHKYAALKKFIERNGLAQELVVYQPDPDQHEWVIVDGHHRAKALREMWDPMDAVPCRDASGLTPAERIELALSLNNNRGELDLSLVSMEIDELLGHGRELPDLEIIGFTMPELEALAGATADVTEDDLLEEALVAETRREEAQEPVHKVFSLEMVLDSARELKRAKALLRRAGGKGNRDLAKGFRALAGLEADDR